VKTLKLLTSLLVGIPTLVDAQAFGVQMGATASNYHARLAGSKNDPTFVEITVPQPNSEFESYLAITTPQTGICKVIGVGRTHKNDDYGIDLRSKYSDLKSTLNERYGKSDDIDFLRSGALWKEPREFVWSLYKHERVLVSYWTPNAGSLLRPPIRALSLEAKSVDPSLGSYLSLSYEFENFPQCQAIMAKAENDSL